MPVYEYRCPQCGIFEKIQKFSDSSLTICPVCGQDVQKMISNAGIVYKGSGYYATDHKNKKTMARKLNQERQKDNEAILDGDVKSYHTQASATDKEVTGL